MFAMNERLIQDTFFVGDLDVCRVLLFNDSTYPWLVLVPRIDGASELHDLSPADQQAIMAELTHASATLKQATGADKINIAAFGNVVAQLHIHVIARKVDHPSWPKPVWGALPPQPYAPDQAATLAQHFCTCLKARPQS